MTVAWKEYQEEATSFFRSLGLDASTDVTVDGVRTTHDIDVLVKSHHVGFEITWVVECKHWKTRVSKLHVLGVVRQSNLETSFQLSVFVVVEEAIQHNPRPEPVDADVRLHPFQRKLILVANLQA